MKRIVGTLAVCMLAASTAFAAVASDTITVTAANGGVFTFNIVAATYAFGTVDANGTANSGGTQSITGSRILPADTGSTYLAPAATTWTVASAPSRTVRIFNASTIAGGSFAWGAGTENRLEMQIPVGTLSGTPATCPFKTFTTIGDGGASGCTLGNLVTGFTAGNGANKATGDLDFRLTVLDTDAVATNTWVVTLTAAAP